MTGRSGLTSNQLTTNEELEATHVASGSSVGSGRRRVWRLNLILAVTAGTLWVSLYSHLGGPQKSITHVPLIVLIGFFALTEVFVVHLKFRHDAHTFSLSEIPLMLGLFCASPLTLVGAQLLGGGVMLAAHRRQRPIKLVFNLTCFALSTLGAELTFHAILGHSSSLGPRGWMAGSAAALVSSSVTVPAIFLAVTLSDGRPAAKELLRPFGFALFGALVTSNIGLLAVEVLAFRPLAELLLMVPTVGLYIAHRAYVGEREKHHSLQFLYDSTRLLNEPAELESAVDAILGQAREALRADLAVLVYRAAESDRIARICIGPGAEQAGNVSVDAEAADQLRAILEESSPSLLFHGGPPQETIRQLAGDIEVRDGIVVTLRGETRVIGVLMIANRVSEVSGFQPADVRLLETLAGHLGVALHNGRLEQSLAQLKVLQRQLTYQATHDSLTGLANRSLFSQTVNQALENARSSRSVAVLFVDLDDFKTANDSLGHAAGDLLLIAVSQRIADCLGAGGMAARLGGDEFAVLVEDVDGLNPAVSIAQRILDSLDRPVDVHGQSLITHASIGMCLSESGDDAAALMRKADTAMYVAKGRGKGCWTAFSPEMHEAALRRQDLIRDLIGALDNDEMILDFQPIISLADDRVLAAEALIRWNHPLRGLIEPANFISLVEETGLIGRLTQVALRQACRVAATWVPDGPSGQVPAVSVNLSALDFERSDLIPQVLSALQDSGLPAERLILEITESLMLNDAPHNILTLRRLASYGVRIALDNFGTGYSSLNYLSQFPLQWLKIAKPFVDQLGLDTAHDAMARGIVQLGHALKLGVIAEGIEEHKQLAMLRQFGCDAGQGFLYSRPMGPGEFDEWLRIRSALAAEGLTLS
jgi:diguanylate cyclase (GGDEF)-like protein